MIAKTEKKNKLRIQLEKELAEVRKKIRDMPWRELEKPMHIGWDLYFTLSKEGLKNDKAKKWLQLLPYCTQPYFVKRDENGEIISSIREDRSFEDVKKYFMTERLLDGRLVYNGPSLMDLSESKYKELPKELQIDTGNTFRFWNVLFIKKQHNSVIKWGGTQITTFTYSLDIPDSCLAITVKKKMATHVQEISSKLMSEKKELLDRLDPLWRVEPHPWRAKNKTFDSRKRKVQNDAIKHLIKGDIADLHEAKKLYKNKRYV